MTSLVEAFISEAAKTRAYHKDVAGYECNGHRHITDLCRELKNIHVFSYLQIFVALFSVVGCVVFRRSVKYIWPQIIPAVLTLTSSIMYLVIYYQQGMKESTKAFNAVIGMALASVLVTATVIGTVVVLFYWFDQIFHCRRAKHFCTSSFIYTVFFLCFTLALQVCVITTGWKYGFGDCIGSEDLLKEGTGSIVVWGLEHCSIGTGVKHVILLIKHVL